MSSMNLSRKIDQPTIDLFILVDRITTTLNMPYLVVGATARDIVCHHRFGTPVKRATTDVDFGIQVSSWKEFESLSQTLVSEGFKTTKSAHSFLCPNNTKLDIVPFGAIENDKSSIQWPPNGEIEMNVLGFKEALDHALLIEITNEPAVNIPVASPQGLMLLKLIAWNDRDRTMRVRDALDIAYLLNNYEADKLVVERLYEESVIEQYDYDVSLASANMLGNDSAAIASDATKRKVLAIINKNASSIDENRLVVEMCTHIETEYEKNLNLLNAFAKGFGR
jgi:predicted nucleotidyltransferase